MRVMAFLVPLLLCCASAHAATWHVAQRRAAASDDNPGTAAAPWKTISRAAGQLQSGDTVIIHEGIYREYVHPRQSGTPAQPITYQAAPGEEVVISGADVITGWVPAGGKLWKKEPWPYRFETHPNDRHHRLIGRCEQVIAGGRLLRQVENQRDMAAGTFAADTAQKVLYVRLPGDADPNAQLMEASVRSVCLGVAWGQQPRHAIHVQGLKFRYAANMAQRGALAAVGDHWLIEDCTIEQTNGSGLSFRGDHATLRRLTCRNNGQQGMGGGGDHFLMEDVVLDHNNVKGFEKDWEAGGVKITKARQGVVRRCRATDNDGVGIWFDIDVRNVLVEGCLCQNNAGHGIFVEISGDFRVQNNLCVHNGTDLRWGLAGIALGESDHCTIEHNLCVGNPTGITLREQGPRQFSGYSGEQVTYHVHDVTIAHNICALSTKYQLGLWWDNSFFGGDKPRNGGRAPTAYDPDQQGLRFDHNLYWPGGKGKLALWGCPWLPKHQEYVDLARWQAERRQDAQSLVADPRFADAATGDWSLRPDSPAAKLSAGPIEPAANSLRRAPTAGWSEER